MSEGLDPGLMFIVIVLLFLVVFIVENRMGKRAKNNPRLAASILEFLMNAISKGGK